MLEVLKPGLWTTVQDLGRFGYRNQGVPLSGVMDAQSAKLANRLVGNPEGFAVLELNLMGPELVFHAPTFIALTGADLSPKINGEPVSLNNVLAIKRDDKVSFGKRKSGARCYLAIAGGFEYPETLGSRSMYPGLTTSAQLTAGARLSFEITNAVPKTVGEAVPLDFTQDIINAVPGPEFELLNKTQTEQLKAHFTVGLNDRMAYQFKELIPNDFRPMISSFVMPGTVQLTPSGQLIVLMRDCQTTGGYPRVLQLTTASINLLSQKMQGEKVKLNLIS